MAPKGAAGGLSLTMDCNEQKNVATHVPDTKAAGIGKGASNLDATFANLEEQEARAEEEEKRGASAM